MSILRAYLAGALAADRSSTLTVLGPDSNTDESTDTETFVQRLIGNQARLHLSGLLRPSAPDGFRVKVSNVPAIGSRKWSRYRRSPNVRLMAVPVRL